MMRLVIIESPFSGARVGVETASHKNHELYYALASANGRLFEAKRTTPIEAVKDVGRQVATAYARAAMRDCLLRGEAPYASHLLYTQPGVLNDDDPEERAQGIEAGLEWGFAADKTVVYTDLGISEGMQQGIDRAKAERRTIEYRKLEGWS